MSFLYDRLSRMLQRTQTIPEILQHLEEKGKDDYLKRLRQECEDPNRRLGSLVGRLKLHYNLPKDFPVTKKEFCDDLQPILQRRLGLSDAERLLRLRELERENKAIQALLAEAPIVPRHTPIPRGRSSAGSSSSSGSASRASARSRSRSRERYLPPPLPPSLPPRSSSSSSSSIFQRNIGGSGYREANFPAQLFPDEPLGGASELQDLPFPYMPLTYDPMPSAPPPPPPSSLSALPSLPSSSSSSSSSSSASAALIDLLEEEPGLLSSGLVSPQELILALESQRKRNVRNNGGGYGNSNSFQSKRRRF